MLGRTYDSQGTDAGNGFGHSEGCPTVEDTKGLAGMLIDWHDSLYAVIRVHCMPSSSTRLPRQRDCTSRGLLMALKSGY